MTKRKRKGGRYTPSSVEHVVVMRDHGEPVGAVNLEEMEAVWLGPPESCAFCASGLPHRHEAADDDGVGGNPPRRQ